MRKVLAGVFAASLLAGCGGGDGGSSPSRSRFVGSYAGTASRTTLPVALGDDYTNATATGTVQNTGRVVVIITHDIATPTPATATETIFAQVDGNGNLSNISLLYSDTNGGTGGNGDPATGTLSVSGTTLTASVRFGTALSGQRYVATLETQ